MRPWHENPAAEGWEYQHRHSYACYSHGRASVRVINIFNEVLRAKRYSKAFTGQYVTDQAL